MKILELNTVSYGSTGKIAIKIGEIARANGHETLFLTGWTKSKRKPKDNNEWIVLHFTDKVVHRLLARITGKDGFFSSIATIRLVKKIKKYKPDIIHLHMVHSYFLNLPLFFKSFNDENIRFVWTFHDCWAFTGGCSHFTLVECQKWRKGCGECVQKLFLVDLSNEIWKKKKEAFTNLQDLTIVTPSYWLANLVKHSFFGKYPIEVINNGIDLTTFRPMKTDFRRKYKCEEKYVILGVAFGWGYKKGLDIFINLSTILDDSYQIVLVGTDSKIDAQLPDNIISIHRTTDQFELASIYNAADVFLNPTREEVFGLVNIEALACGTPVITFNTGGSPECIDESCGIVLRNHSTDSIINAINEIKKNGVYMKDHSIKRALKFDENKCYQKYIELYEKG